jgi:PAS domain S-box-containing protein
MVLAAHSQIAVCLALTGAISKARTVDEIYGAALEALAQGLSVSRSSILLFDSDNVMRFKASRGLSEAYRKAVEGHSPWTPDTPDSQPIVVADVTREPSLAAFLPTIEAEGIAAMTFVPLVSLGRVIGKFMLYYPVPHDLGPDELQLAGVIASQVAFAVERTRAEESARRSEERLRFALDAASMGTWDWELATQSVRWSDNLERVHGLPSGTFDGTFASYEREIHPEDRPRVLAAARRAIEEGAPYEVEYRIVAPDGTVRWVEGKGRVEYEAGRPARMNGVCMIVTRRKEAELARLAAAEEASRLKDEFLATLSHELRTPMNAILGWVQMVQADGLPPERARRALEVISRNARLQAQLIEDILDVSRIITGKLEVERLPILAPQLVDTAIAGILPAASAKQIDIVREMAETVPPLEGDPKRLHQVLGNVLSNAVKFTPEHGRVRVSCGVEGDHLTIAVRDSGIGIPTEFLPFVFERFRQADSRSTRQHGGLGLGLAIARHIVELHGGEIEALSDGAGRGSTILIRLPFDQAGRRSESAMRRVRACEAPAAIRLDGMRLLVVDDQPDSRELLTALLSRCGADVVECESAAAALEALKSTTVHLIVADIAMPDVDGFELIERIRRHRGRMPAVAVSAYARPEDRTRAVTAGYDGYCAKPVDVSEFLRTVSAVLSSSPQPAG